MKKEDEKDEDKKPPAREITLDQDSPNDELDSDNGSSAWSPAVTPFASAPFSTTPGKQTGRNEDHLPLSFFRRRFFQEEIILLSGASLISIVVFLYVVLPFTALAALATFATSTSLIFFTTYQHVRDEFNDRIERRGFGDYLPESLWRTLTEVSLHENLQDPSMQIEYQHMMVYFLPGVTGRHLDRYLQRMSPAHRERLLRPGLGWFLGDNFMRLILGNERMPRRIPAIEQGPPATPPPTNRLLYDDETVESDLGLAITSNDLAGGLTDQQATDMVRRLGVGDQVQDTPGPVTTATPATGTNDDNYIEEESALVMDAFWVSVYYFVDPIVEFMTETALDIARPVTTTTFRYSLGLSIVSGGLGLIGYWRGNYSLPSVHMRAPSSDTVWSTALFGGVSAGVMLYARSYMRKPKDDGSKRPQ